MSCSTRTAQFVANLAGSVTKAHIEHLNTKDYERHKSLDEYYKDMPELMDVLAEALLGSKPTATIPAPSLLTTSNFEKVLDDLYAEGLSIHKMLEPTLTNPLEDILTFMMQIKYKLRLK